MDLLGDDDVHGSLPRFSDEALSISLQISSGEGHPSRQQLIPRMPPPPPPPPPPPRNMLFYKTRLCGKFSWGFCPYGSNCCFAHGPQDLRNPPPNWQEIVAGEQTLGMNWNQHRTQDHNGEEGLPPMPNPFESNHPETLQVLSSSAGDGFGSHQRVGPWKPKLCHKWEATGHCPYGATCLFAHGYAELKKFGGHLELSRTKVREAPSKTLLDPSNNDSPSKTEPACKHQANKKSFLKWKDPKKISRIYADWIDDIPLFTHTSLTKATR